MLSLVVAARGISRRALLRGRCMSESTFMFTRWPWRMEQRSGPCRTLRDRINA